MKACPPLMLTLVACMTVNLSDIAAVQTPRPPPPSWNARAAAAYLDGRLEWWLRWPNAARDHDTTCVSCHTAVPYALACPALRAALGQHDVAAPERAMVASVIKRVTRWNEVEPFYPDQIRGLPKTSESRGTEAILNALVLTARDTSEGTLSSEGREAMAHMWALQFKAGELKGAWAWLNFHYEPWESSDGVGYGAALAALAIGMAPEIHERCRHGVRGPGADVRAVRSELTRQGVGTNDD